MSTVPVYQEYMQPLLDVLRRESRAVPIEELDVLVISAMGLAPDIVTVPHDPEKPDRSEVSYRLAWARTYLKKAGLLENAKRGVWAISEAGRRAGPIDGYALASSVAQTYRTPTASDGSETEAAAAAEDGEDTTDEELVAARVGDELARQLKAVHERLAAEGALVPVDFAAKAYRRFREAFGPDVLAGLDGEPLLLKMHARPTKDSLVYWLEFKDDDELTSRFGSIGGGSALKFGIYQAADTGQWMTGSSKQQRRLEIDEAVAIARKQRDQLVAGARILASLPEDAAAIDYSVLQGALEQAAKDVAESAWGHKYFSLLFPTVLPPIHGVGYQEHQLYKLLKIPGRGRYENARIFSGVARQLGMSLLDLAVTLHHRNGGSHRYWRIGTTTGSHSEWERMRVGGFAAMGWDAIGDLSNLPRDPQGRAEIRRLVEERYYDGKATSPGEAASLTKTANQIYHFLAAAQERDVVVAMDGARVLGIGQIVGDYAFQAGDGPFPHRRPVQWLRTGNWKLPKLEGMRTTFVPIRQAPNIVDVEARLLGTAVSPAPTSVRPPPPTNGNGAAQPAAPPPLPALSGVVARVAAVLQRKRQVILFGPPGTGKTYWAERAAEQLAARAWFSQDSLEPAKRTELRNAGAIEVCSFHPAYGYEDFLEGYRPSEKDGQLTFELRDGIFKKIAARAAKDANRPYYLIIDEINRGDIPRIFGELLTVLEREKRGKPIRLPLSGATFSVPENVYVIGTMNTADRSIALLDAALRRRFGFVELLPDSSALKGVSIAGLPLGPWLDEVNRRIVKHVGRDARHLQIGHSYFMSSSAPIRELGRFVEVLRDDVVPLLEEYCYEDFQVLERILGSGIVHASKQRIDTELFAPEKHGDLMQKLLAAFDEITATRVAAEAEDDEHVDDDEDDDADEGPHAPAPSTATAE